MQCLSTMEETHSTFVGRVYVDPSMFEHVTMLSASAHKGRLIIIAVRFVSRCYGFRRSYKLQPSTLYPSSLAIRPQMLYKAYSRHAFALPCVRFPHDLAPTCNNGNIQPNRNFRRLSLQLSLSHYTQTLLWTSSSRPS